LRQSLMDAPGYKANDGKMLDHELLLFGGQQIARPLPLCGSGRDSWSFLLRIFWGDLTHRADVLCRWSTATGTPVTFACFLHIHHPTCVRQLELRSGAENNEEL
jgi:hypothetical protein